MPSARELSKKPIKRQCCRRKPVLYIMADVHVSYRLSEVRQAHPTVGLLFNITVALGQKP